MRDIHERINAAIERVTSGQAPVRVPVDETDVDVVLANADEEIKRLEAETERLRGYLRRLVEMERRAGSPRRFAEEVSAMIAEVAP